MAKLRIFLDKSLEENAGIYYDKAKKIKKKIAGAEKALQESYAKLEKAKETVEKKAVKIKRKKEWFEKFRWFFTSSGNLVIAGRDATTNDILIKKHLSQKDIVFHADITGSPFCIVKLEDTIKKDEIEEVSQFCAAMSRAFRMGLSELEVYWVNPDQISQEAPAGEYLTKGAFMIYGKKNVVHAQISIYVGIMEDSKVMAGPENACKKNCIAYAMVKPGRLKKTDAAKKIKYFFKQKGFDAEIDDIISVMPAGDCEVVF